LTPSGVLAIHPGALGDVLLAIPALRAVRTRAGGEPLTLGAQPRVGALLVALGVVDEAVAFESLGLDALFLEGPLPERTWALARARRVVCWFGARDAVFVRRLREVCPDASVVASVGEHALVWEHLLRTVAAPPGSWRGPVVPPPALLDRGRALLREAGGNEAVPLLIVHPGAGSPAKCWPADGFVHVIAAARAAGWRVAVHEGIAGADATAAAALRSRLGAEAVGVRRPDLAALAGALAAARVYVGNDSGISHLAATLGVPSLVLFTRATLRWQPWGESARPVVVSTASASAAEVTAVLRNVEALMAGVAGRR
jgi:hypothetical protein